MHASTGCDWWGWFTLLGLLLQIVLDDCAGDDEFVGVGRNGSSERREESALSRVQESV